MKKLCIIIMMMMLVGVSSFAQQKEEHRNPMKDRARLNLTAKEKAILKSKQLTLALNLTERQQEQFQKLYVDRAEDKVNMRKEKNQAVGDGKFKEEAFERINTQLDKRIAFQQSIQKILNEDQYMLWKDSQSAEKRKRMMAFKGHRSNFRNKQKSPK